MQDDEQIKRLTEALMASLRALGKARALVSVLTEGREDLPREVREFWQRSDDALVLAKGVLG
jgi:hypothetical protein